MTTARAGVFAPATALALLAGTAVAMRATVLPPGWALGIVAAAGLLLWWRGRRRWPGAFLFGFGWALLHGQWALDARLPHGLEGQDLRVQVRVVGFADRTPNGARFDARIEAVLADGGIAEDAGKELVGRRVRLGWYGQPPAFEPGARWRLTVRLKRPRGGLNPGGFDFERRALERRLAATGYVRDTASAEPATGGGGIDLLRLRLSERIQQAVPRAGARFVRALALADTRGLSQQDWEVLRATGLTHLIAISGFHVGVVAGFGVLLVRVLYWLAPTLGRRLPRPQAAALGALAVACGYAALAGFGLPTVRTVLMIAAALAAVLLRRASGPARSITLALLVVLLADPLAVLAPGFWLSFTGVAWLMWCLPRERGTHGWARDLLRAQGVATLALLPLTVWFFNQASVAGPLVNLVGIPLVSLVVVPLSLAGAALVAAWPWAGAPLLVLAAGAMDLFWSWLEGVAATPGALLWFPEPAVAALLLAVAGTFWLLLPRGIPGKWLAPLLMLPLLWPAQPRLADGEVEVALIDVGQGLAVLVRTRTHALLVDAGPAWPGGLDMGEAAVLPTLRALGVRRLDALVVSHADSDHAGGLGAVRRAFPPGTLLAPEGAGIEGADVCAGARWQRDGVDFRMLHPPPHFPYLGNESSCVLRVEGKGGVVLLPGDIGRPVEGRLVREQADALAARVLVVPHHGSRHSSTQGFVDAVAPELALVGAGHRNAFGMPRPEVVARYLDGGATLLSTAEHGMLRVRMPASGDLEVERRRGSHRRFWHEPGG
ncbi:DNA internalization-related competence protein ComEC/Rec2 [Coralloluteibacterium thermophilus]|uniref:DNA internalization-related competence protein ComEC/Rec2 n=1 Tax=Coralloluteibacterium thermophilum TaxID=2707049 RepID=A0ABV9NLA1_9GAMM